MTSSDCFHRQIWATLCFGGWLVTKSIIRLGFVACGLIAFNLSASTLFEANLDGAQEPTASTATGFGTVVLNNAQDMITVDLSWTGLVGGPATAAHIHCCALPGVNAGVLFPFVIPNVTSGSMVEQTFAITPSQVSELEGGLMYMNIHNATFPGGEIRGQLDPVAPEPASTGLIGFGFAALSGLGVAARRRRTRAPND
jgi:hypothetical protein